MKRMLVLVIILILSGCGTITDDKPKIDLEDIEKATLSFNIVYENTKTKFTINPDGAVIYAGTMKGSGFKEMDTTFTEEQLKNLSQYIYETGIFGQEYGMEKEGILYSVYLKINEEEQTAKCYQCPPQIQQIQKQIEQMWGKEFVSVA